MIALDYIICKCLFKRVQGKNAVGTASVNFVESDLGCTARIYFDNVTLTLHNIILTSHQPYKYNNQCDCSKQAVIIESKKEDKDQESIQSSTTPDHRYQLDSNKLTI